MTRSPSRRALLSAGVTGAGLLLAGCTSSEPPGGETSTEQSQTSEVVTETESAETTTERQKALSTSGAWPTFQFDAANTGYSPDARGPREAVATYWRVSANDAGIGYESPPVVASDTVFLGNDSGIDALDAATGTTRWRTDFDPSDGSVNAPVAVADQTAYACAYSGVYAVDATDGTMRWNTDALDVGGLTAPAVTASTLYTCAGGNGSGCAYALNVSDGNLRWQYEFDGDTRSAPATTGDAVVFASTKQVFALNSTDGTVRWQFTPANPVRTSPAIGAETVYVVDSSGVVSAIDAASGTERWQSQGVVPRDRSAPAVGDGALYVGGREGIASLATEEGTENWTHSVDDETVTTPAVAADTVYTGTSDGYLLALDTTTGEQRWEFRTREVRHEDAVYRSVSKPPAVVNGGVFATTDGGDVYALGED